MNSGSNGSWKSCILLHTALSEDPGACDRACFVDDVETPEILPLPPQGARAGMDPNAARGHHRHMHVAWWGCQLLTLHLGPLSGLKIKAPQLLKLRVATVAAVNLNCFFIFTLIFMVQSYMVHACAWPRIGIGAFIAPFFGPEVEVPEFRQHANAIAVTCPSELRKQGFLQTNPGPNNVCQHALN